MPQRPRIAVALIVGIIALFAPIIASIYLAWTESVASERARNLSYAGNVLHRVEETANQFGAGKWTVDSAKNLPCSPQDIEVMRQIDLGSNYIQATGRTSGDTLLCTSLGTTTPVDLGKPTLISAHGVSEYFHVKVYPNQWHPVNVFSSGGFAAIVDPRLAIDIPTEGNDVELAIYVPSASGYSPFENIGKTFPSGWFKTIAPGSHLTFLDSGYLVSEARSANWDLAVVAATPDAYVYRRVWRFVLIFAPIGILGGVLLAWAVSYVTKTLTSFPAIVRRAARRRDFFVEYQPVIELATRKIIGAEALVRWRAPLGIVRPEHFIPLAEERGLIPLITEQVMLIVARDLPAMLALNPEFRIGLNMSATDLRLGNTVVSLQRLMRTSGALPKNIEVEATERAFLQGLETAALIRQLRELGFSVAIDDFGTGYSSLACLQSLALDTLKIDKAFIDTINTDGATSQVVLHIIDMAHSLQLHIIAEGVETEVQAQFLAQRGVTYAQGFLFSKPVPIDILLQNMKQLVSDGVLTFS